MKSRFLSSITCIFLRSCLFSKLTIAKKKMFCIFHLQWQTLQLLMSSVGLFFCSRCQQWRIHVVATWIKNWRTQASHENRIGCLGRLQECCQGASGVQAGWQKGFARGMLSHFVGKRILSTLLQAIFICCMPFVLFENRLKVVSQKPAVNLNCCDCRWKSDWRNYHPMATQTKSKRSDRSSKVLVPRHSYETKTVLWQRYNNSILRLPNLPPSLENYKAGKSVCTRFYKMFSFQFLRQNNNNNNNNNKNEQKGVFQMSFESKMAKARKRKMKVELCIVFCLQRHCLLSVQDDKSRFLFPAGWWAVKTYLKIFHGGRRVFGGAAFNQLVPMEKVSWAKVKVFMGEAAVNRTPSKTTTRYQVRYFLRSTLLCFGLENEVCFNFFLSSHMFHRWSYGSVEIRQPVSGTNTVEAAQPAMLGSANDIWSG